MRKKMTAIVLGMMITHAVSPLAFAGERAGLSEMRTDLMPAAASASRIGGFSETLALLNVPSKDAPAPSSNSKPQSEGRDYFVSTTGSDDNDGSSKYPWRSIPLAVSQLEAGDKLTIFEGVYEGPANFLCSGEDGRPITVRGLGLVVIDGTKTGRAQAVIKTNGQSHLYLRNLTVLGPRTGIEVTGGHHVLIDELKTGQTPCAVAINDAAFVTVKSPELSSGSSLYVAGGESHDLLFEGLANGPSEEAQVQARNLIFGPSIVNARVRITVSKHSIKTPKND